MLILRWNYIVNENAHQAMKNAVHGLKIQNMPYLNGSYNLVLPHASMYKLLSESSMCNKPQIEIIELKSLKCSSMVQSKDIYV